MVACHVLAVMFFGAAIWATFVANPQDRLPVRFTAIFVAFMVLLIVLSPFGVVTILMFIGMAVAWIAIEVGVAYKYEAAAEQPNMLANTRIYDER
jgi:hypothetical protein